MLEISLVDKKKSEYLFTKLFYFSQYLYINHQTLQVNTYNVFISSVIAKKKNLNERIKADGL